MNVKKIDVDHKREGWRDWFIIDEPVKSSKLMVWIDKSFIFRIDPRFDYYKINGSQDEFMIFS